MEGWCQYRVKMMRRLNLKIFSSIIEILLIHILAKPIKLIGIPQ